MSEDPKSTSSSMLVEQASKATALIIAVVYALGYLVTSLDLAQYGVVSISPFKPKVAAAGILCVTFLGLPAFVHRFVFFSRPTSSLHNRDKSKIINCWRYIALYALVVGITFTLDRIFIFDRSIPLPRLYALASLGALASLITWLILTKARFNRLAAQWQTALSAISILVLAAVIVILFPMVNSKSFSRLDVAAWLFYCAVGFGLLGLSTPEKLGGAWPSTAVQLTFPIWLFATYLYPHIKGEWGGGKHVQAAFRFTKDSAVLPSQKARYTLLDENDSGFYVVRQASSHAIYIPRAYVAAIAYSADESDLP